jgi:membrane protease YdiL (CAAX protease family)
MTQTAETELSSGDPSAPHCPYHNRISAICAWIIIIACVALIITLNHLSTEQRQAESPDVLEPNVPLELAARYAVGATDAFSNLRSQQRQTTVDSPMVYLRQLGLAARSTPDHLRIAIVAGELSGASAALKRIDALGAELRSPPLAADAQALRSIYSLRVTTLDSKSSQRLVRRYGWFGHLALGFGKNSGNVDRRIALKAAVRAVMVILAVGGVAFVSLLAGFVLLVIAMVQLADGKLRRAYVPVSTNTIPFLEGFAVYLVLSIAVSMLVGRFSGHLTLSAAYFLAGCVPVATALVWPLVRGISWAELRYGLGWNLGTGLVKEMLRGIIGYVAGLPLLTAGALLTLVLTRLTGAVATHPIVNQAAGLSSAIRLFLLASVYAPLAEESLFRGALFHHMRHRHSWWISALVVSLIFAAMHPQGWAAIPPLAMIAVTLAAIREWRGTIVASATAHALNNTMIMLVLVIATS